MWQNPPPSLLIERYQKRKAETEGVALSHLAKMKAILKPAHCERVYRQTSNYFEMWTGKTVAMTSGMMRLNVYEGGREEESEDPEPPLCC